ncbi:MAG: L,D-transpeptidase family protein [Clostridia bacterium]|nr:L,D-transpeptidase family protein [Clostridia bacterium]
MSFASCAESSNTKNSGSSSNATETTATVEAEAKTTVGTTDATEVTSTETETVAYATAETVAESVDDNSNEGGFMTYNNVCTQDEYEQTIFGQPISTERDGEVRLGIKCTHDIYAEISVYVAKDGKYEKTFTCPAVIGKNGPGKHAEGDTKTPLGTWTIGEAYGIKENPGALLPYTVVTDDMYWCATGAHGKKYNQLIYKSEEPDENYDEDEHLIDYPGVYDYFIDLGYNKSGAPYVGNAIFLHVWRNPDHYTGGCVAVSEENMVQLLKILPVGTIVTIY